MEAYRISSASPCHAERLVYLDGWRGLAVLLVTIGHFAPFPTGKLAGIGVELFFVLSGRLMADLLILERQPLPTFFVRRASRILPALLAYVATVLLFEIFFALMTGGSIRLTGAAGAIGFFTNYLPSARIDLAFEHCWSLAVEEHGYVALALIAWLAGRRRRPVMALVVGLAILAAANGPRLLHDPEALGNYAYWRSDVRAASIFMGFALRLWAARYFVQDRSGFWRHVAPVCLMLGIAIHLAGALPEYVRFTIGTLLLALAVNTLDSAPLGRRALEWRGLAALGLVSFSLYLWQQPFMLLARHGGWPIWLATAIGCGIWSYVRIERPARRWLNGIRMKSAMLQPDRSSAGISPA